MLEKLFEKTFSVCIAIYSNWLSIDRGRHFMYLLIHSFTSIFTIFVIFSRFSFYFSLFPCEPKKKPYRKPLHEFNVSWWVCLSIFSCLLWTTYTHHVHIYISIQLNWIEWEFRLPIWLYKILQCPFPQHAKETFLFHSIRLLLNYSLGRNCTADLCLNIR